MVHQVNQKRTRIRRLRKILDQDYFNFLINRSLKRAPEEIFNELATDITAHLKNHLLRELGFEQKLEPFIPF